MFSLNSLGATWPGLWVIHREMLRFFFCHRPVSYLFVIHIYVEHLLHTRHCVAMHFYSFNSQLYYPYFTNKETGSERVVHLLKIIQRIWQSQDSITVLILQGPCFCTKPQGVVVVWNMYFKTCPGSSRKSQIPSTF